MVPSALLATILLSFSFFSGSWPRISFPQGNFAHQVIEKPVMSTVKPLSIILSLPTVRFNLKPNPISTPLPKATASPTPAATPLPILTPRPSATPSPAPTGAPIVTPSSALINYGDQTDYFLEQINNYRRSQGLSPVQPDPYTCNFAAIRAQEITTAFNHNGFNKRISSKSLPYPGYHYVTENLAHNSDYKNVVSTWINSPGHAANMRADTPFACVKSSGDYYAYEGWKP